MLLGSTCLTRTGVSDANEESARARGALWDAQTTADIKKIVDAVKASSGALAIPVGRPNNIGTIRMASYSGLALVERVTNGIEQSVGTRCTSRAPYSADIA